VCVGPHRAWVRRPGSELAGPRPVRRSPTALVVQTAW
jgi:hypothetical protein